eukprot:jgi/Mesvir1/4139/Mv13051-RA.1
MPNPSSAYPRNPNQQELTLLLSGDDMDNVEAGKTGSSGAGTHFSMPGAIPESNLGSAGAQVHQEAEGRIDGKDDNTDDGGNQSDTSDDSEPKQPYYVSRYKGIDLTSGPSGSNNTPKGVYRRSDPFRPKKSTMASSSLAPPRKTSGNLGEPPDPPPLRNSGGLGLPPSNLSTSSTAAPMASFPSATPRVGTVTHGSIPPSVAEPAPGAHVNINVPSEAERNFLKSLWGQMANVAREKTPPEQRVIGYFGKARATKAPSRRLVSYNRSPTRGRQAAFQAEFHTSGSSSSESDSAEILSPVTPASLGTKSKVVGGGGGGNNDTQPLLLVDIAGGDKDSVQGGEVKVFPEKPAAANGVLMSHPEKPAAPLGKEGSAVDSGVKSASVPAPATTKTKSSRSVKSQKHASKLLTKKLEEPSDWDDGLIYGYRLNGNGGATKISLADWITNPGTPEEPVWIHLNGMCAGAHKWLWEESGLERLVVEALTADDARPRSSSFNFGTLFVIRAVNTGGTPEDMVSVRLFLQPELLVTVRRRMLAAEEDVMEPLMRGRGPRTAAGVAVLLVEKCTLRMGPVVGEMEDLLDCIEREWVEKGNSEALSNDLGNLRRRVVQMRRYIQPQRDALVDLLVEDSEAPEWHEWHRQRLREVANSTTRMMEDLAVVWERSNVLHEEMKGLAAERQGKRLYIMTMMTAVFLPLTFVTGLLGINVGGIPFRGGPTENNEGFWVVVCVCGCIVVLEVILMKALGWMQSG